MNYTTSRGIKISFLPIARETLLRFRTANPEPKPPTYKVTTGTGVEEIHEHDKTTVRTDEERAALAAYDEAQSNYALRYLRFFTLRGLEIHADMSEWLEEQAYIGLPKLENKAEERFEWITSCVLSTKADYQAVMLGVIRASGAPEELLTQIGATFRGDVQREGADVAPDGRELGS